MGYERYLQNTDPRGDADGQDDLGQSRYGRPQTGDWDRGDDGAPRRSSVNSTYGGYNQTTDGGRLGARDGGDRPYRGSYAADGRRFAEGNADRDNDWNSYGERPSQRPSAASRGGSARANGYEYDDRTFVNRAGDEVRSWFGDDDAERRRELDRRYDERLESGGHINDADYDSWRRRQIEALDRDYAEYRRENQDRFHSEFNNWRTERQGQRSSLSRVEEHMEVVGSDDEHVGTVDKLRGDRIILTKSDPNAGGHHHSIPSRWIETVDDKVKIRKTAAEAIAHWKDEERNQAMFATDGQAPNSTSASTSASGFSSTGR